MGDLIEDQVFIDLVGMDKDVCISYDTPQRLDIGGPQDGAGRIVRGVQEDHPRPGCYPAAHFLPVDAVVRELEVDPYGYGSVDLYIRHITVVGRFKDDDFVAWPEYRRKCGVYGIGSAGGDGDLGIRIDGGAIESGYFCGEDFPEGDQ